MPKKKDVFARHAEAIFRADANVPEPIRSVLSPAGPSPKISDVGRDPPDYTHLANAIVERNLLAPSSISPNAARELALDVRHELRTAYSQGRSDALKPEIEADLDRPDP